MLLSRTFKPSPDLAPFIRRFYIFEAELPPEMVIEDFLLSETAFIRCLLRGDWKGEIAPLVWSQPGKTLLFGANELPFKVRVQGSFTVVGIALRPSGWRALFSQSHREFKDRMFTLQDAWGSLADDIQTEVEKAADDDAIIAAFENGIHKRLDSMGTRRIDKQIAKFEVIARTNSGIKVDVAAREVGLSVRQLERRCHLTFGLSPKAILRRSRFLDMATAMRGFSSPSEADLAEMRYFDQSHIAREFKRFTRMTPTAFANAITPLQTAGLKLREESKYEE